MVTSVSSILGCAAKSLGQCANAVKAKAGPSGLTLLEYEQVTGFGVASDWARWAQLLLTIKYSVIRYSRETPPSWSSLSESVLILGTDAVGI